MSAADESTEESPLIRAPDSNPDEGECLRHETQWTRNAIRTTSLAAAFLTLYAFADVLKYISTVRLIELGVCREHHLRTSPGLIDADGRVPEHLCKSPEIQQRLAHLRGYLAAAEAMVGLFLTIPYALLVGWLGERLLTGINVVGYLLSCAWLLVVCFCWSSFPIWTAVLAPLFRVVGGGSPVLASVISSIAAKNVPAASRSLCFFVFTAAQLLSEIVAITTAAQLLDRQFLLTPLMLNFPIGLLCLAIVCAIRPDDTVSLPGPKSGRTGEGGRYQGSVKASIRIISQIFRRKSVLALLATVPVAKMVNPINELMLQYIPKKFDMSLASASRTLSIQAVESLFLLLVVLPHVKTVAQVKSHVRSSKVDLYITQYGFLAMSLGCLVMAFSQDLIIFVTGILIFTLGCSTRPALQSVLTDLFSREHIAILYTVIAVGDGIGSAAGALILNRSLAIAIRWDDRLYLGLPFVIGALCYMFGFATSLAAGDAALSRPRPR